MPAPTEPTANRHLRSFQAGVAGVLIVASHLLWSSPEYRQQQLLLASLLALLAFWPVLWPVLRHSGWHGLALGSGLLLAHGASWLGGLWHGGGIASPTAAAAQGLVAVVGLAVLVAVLADPRWHRPLKWTAFGVLALITLGSLVGYFVSIERFIVLGDYSRFFDTLRLALIWPTRMLSAGFGQIAWDNANYAAFYFALALVLILESIAPGTRRRGIRWFWCVVLSAEVYLTASRGGGLMVVLALPIILVGRPPRFAAKALLAVLVGIVCGYGGLQVKIALLQEPPAPEPVSVRPPAAEPKPQPATAPKTPPVAAKPVQPSPAPKPELTTATHSTKYFSRASAGRVKLYRILWRDMAGSRMCGKGLATTGQSISYLNHEHSTFMATLRGGGLIALAGHALVLAAAASAAWRLLRRGLRWPAVLLVATIAGLLFDRSSVIALTGNYEFIAHWVAVLIPVLLASCKNKGSVLAW